MLQGAAVRTLLGVGRPAQPGWGWPVRRPRVTLLAGRFPSRLLGRSWFPPLLLGHPVNVFGSPVAAWMGF